MPDTQVPIIYQVSPEANVGGGPITLASGLICGDPTVDNGPRLEQLASELFPRGGTIQLPACDIYHQSRINLSTFIRDTTFLGRGGTTGGAPAATRIIYNGPNQNAWGCLSTTGLRWEKLQLLCASDLTGTNFMDWSFSAFNSLSDVFIAGTGEGAKKALGLINLNEAQQFHFNRSIFESAVSGCRGKIINSGFSNVGSWYDCNFQNFVVAPIVNPGEAWNFYNPSVEALSNGEAGFALCLNGMTTHTFGIYGGWFGDVEQPADKGNWLQLSGNSIKTIGAQMGGGESWLRAGDNGVTDGVEISGHFDTVQHTATAVGGFQHSNWFILPIAPFNSGGLQMAAGTPMPTRSIINNPNGAYWNLGTMFSHAGPIADGSFPETPPDLTDGYDTINNKHYIRSGGVWRSVQYV